jgi:jasmonate ZIM domain-containing protein
MSSSGQKSGKAPERSNFAQTCSLLSKYMKERRNFGSSDLSLLGAESTNQLPTTTTLNLLTNLENSPDNGGESDSVSRKMSNNGGAQIMTIFYGGRVLVFNDLPADKAKESMALAYAAAATASASGNGAGNIIPDLNIVSTPPPIQPRSHGSDLPIARRNSLHRFLEKRKDRSLARAPYQIVSGKPEGSSRRQLELELFAQ